MNNIRHNNENFVYLSYKFTTTPSGYNNNKGIKTVIFLKNSNDRYYLELYPNELKSFKGIYLYPMFTLPPALLIIICFNILGELLLKNNTSFFIPVWIVSVLLGYFLGKFIRQKMIKQIDITNLLKISNQDICLIHIKSITLELFVDSFFMIGLCILAMLPIFNFPIELIQYSLFCGFITCIFMLHDTWDKVKAIITIYKSASK